MLRFRVMMNIRFKLFGGLVCFWGCVPSWIAGEVEMLKTADAFFQDTKIWSVALTVTPENYTSLEPKAGRGFGADFEYVRANVGIAGGFFEDVGLRY